MLSSLGDSVYHSSGSFHYNCTLSHSVSGELSQDIQESWIRVIYEVLTETLPANVGSRNQ